MSVQPTQGYQPPGFWDRLVSVAVWALYGLCTARFRARARASALVALDRFAGADAKAGRTVVIVRGTTAPQTCRYCGEAITRSGRDWWCELTRAVCPLSPGRRLHDPLVIPQQRSA